MRRDRHAHAVRFLDDAFLHEVRQTDVRLHEVEIEVLRVLQRERDLPGIVEREAAGVVNARAVEGLAGGEEPRTDPRARLPRLAALPSLVRVRRRIPHGRNAP